jgi:hypothetical protein
MDVKSNIYDYNGNKLPEDGSAIPKHQLDLRQWTVSNIIFM